MWGGVKAICVWPTNPQLYVKGELTGGCNSILEMQVRAFVWVVVDVGWCESYLRLAYKPTAVRQGEASEGVRHYLGSAGACVCLGGCRYGVV